MLFVVVVSKKKEASLSIPGKWLVYRGLSITKAKSQVPSTKKKRKNCRPTTISTCNNDKHYISKVLGRQNEEIEEKN